MNRVCIFCKKDLESRPECLCAAYQAAKLKKGDGKS